MKKILSRSSLDIYLADLLFIDLIQFSETNVFGDKRKFHLLIQKNPEKSNHYCAPCESKKGGKYVWRKLGCT
jgi:hypothetical protein